MTLVRRKVRISATCKAKAMRMFPPGGSVDGSPTYEQFSANVLTAAEIALGRDFEAYADSEGGAAFVTSDAQLFRAIVFFAEEIDGEVEIYDFEIDDDWSEVGLDPDEIN